MKIEKAKQSGPKSIECDVCKKLYWTEEEVRAHIKVYHSGDGPQCQKTLQTGKTLQLHLEKHEIWSKIESQKKWKKLKKENNLYPKMSLTNVFNATYRSNFVANLFVLNKVLKII